MNEKHDIPMLGARVATKKTDDLKLIQIDTTEELRNVLGKIKSVQGYATTDDFCLPLVDATNYYVKPSSILNLYHNNFYSICELKTACNDKNMPEVHSIACNLEYLLVNEGEQCLLDNYKEVRYLIPSTMSLFNEDKDPANSMINLYCLYGEDAQNIIADNNKSEDQNLIEL